MANDLQIVEPYEIGKDKVKNVDTFDIVTPTEIVVPSYDYGRSQEQLDYKTQIRKKPNAGGNIKIGHFTITATGSKVITGVGFTPTNLQIISNISGGTGPIKSIGFTDGTNMYNTYDYNTTTGMKSYYVTTSVVFVEDGSSGSFLNTTATITSLDVDGFTLNVTNKTLAGTMECTYLAYR